MVDIYMYYHCHLILYSLYMPWLKVQLELKSGSVHVLPIDTLI